jgi:hypothetical protein
MRRPGGRRQAGDNAGMPALRPEEEWARSIISRVLATPVEQNDDGTEPGMYDLRILYPDRPAGAVEVTAAADRESIELWRLMNESNERWQVERLVGGWSVHVLPTARAKRLRSELPSLLLSLEQAGRRELRIDLAAHGGRLLERSARRLGVVHAFQSGTDFPGSIYVNLELPPEQTGGWVADTGDALAEWLGDFLTEPRQEDVRQKLARSRAAERHAFVLIPGFSTAAFAVIDLLIREGAPLPNIDPRLPPEITDVWAVSSWSSGVGFHCSSETGWLIFDKGAGLRVGDSGA